MGRPLVEIEQFRGTNVAVGQAWILELKNGDAISAEQTDGRITALTTTTGVCLAPYSLDKIR